MSKYVQRLYQLMRKLSRLLCQQHAMAELDEVGTSRLFVPVRKSLEDGIS